MRRYQKIFLVALPLVIGVGVAALLISKPGRSRNSGAIADETPHPMGASLQPVRAAGAPVQKPGEIDLLALLQVSRDVVHGSWGFQGASLVTPAAQWARVAVPCIPPEEYDLRIVATRRQGTDSLNIGFVYGGRQGMLMVDGNGGETSWIDLVTPPDLASNESAVLGKYLKWNRPTQVLVSVRKGGVAVSVDQAKVLEWKGEPAELKLIPGFRIPNRKELFIGAWDTVLVIDELVLIPVTGSPVFPP